MWRLTVMFQNFSQQHESVGVLTFALLSCSLVSVQCRRFYDPQNCDSIWRTFPVCLIDWNSSSLRLTSRVKQAGQLEAQESSCKPCPVTAASPVCGSDGHNYASEVLTVEKHLLCEGCFLFTGLLAGFETPDKEIQSACAALFLLSGVQASRVQFPTALPLTHSAGAARRRGSSQEDEDAAADEWLTSVAWHQPPPLRRYSVFFFIIDPCTVLNFDLALEQLGSECSVSSKWLIPFSSVRTRPTSPANISAASPLCLVSASASWSSSPASRAKTWASCARASAPVPPPPPPPPPLLTQVLTPNEASAHTHIIILAIHDAAVNSLMGVDQYEWMDETS